MMESQIYMKIVNQFYILPMERMTKGEWMTPEEYIAKLGEENKNLKEKLEQIKETYIRFEDSEKEYNKWLWYIFFKWF